MSFNRVDLIKEAETYRGKKVTIDGDPKRVYQFDGDHFVSHERLEMEIEPLCLKVLVPESLNSF
jgi:diacylglycerol kinase family enzyme